MTTQKHAILLVSFGTSFAESRKKTIDKIQDDIMATFSNYRIYQAWTSKKLIRTVYERERLLIPTLEDAMAQIISDGMTDLTVQPTYLINSSENDTMKKTILSLAPSSLTVRFGSPLLTSTADNCKVLHAIMSEFSTIPSKDALIFVGHGTETCANSVYATLNDLLKDMGYPHAFIGTIKDYSNQEVLIQHISHVCSQRVHLIPFMFVAGHHATKEIFGNNRDSWKSRLESAGFEVLCHMKGLGEYEGVREIYLEHLKAAIKHKDYSFP